MDDLSVTDPMRRRWLGVTVMVGIALLQLSTEYMGTRDVGRFLSKGSVLLVGLPLLTMWGFAVFRFASRTGSGTIGPLFVGAITSGIGFAGLLPLTQLASAFLPILKPQYAPWSGLDSVRVGFAMGLTSFALWALAFVVPFAVEDARIRALEAEKLRAQAQLAQLRAHLEPHFLLNTLNAIAGLVTEDPPRACRMIGTLGDLLRDSMAPGDELQTLEQQVEWLRRYASILEERHAGHLAFNWQVGQETRSALLPRLLLQPLVENAVKHGALMRAGGGEITVRTEVTDRARLVCVVEDNGPGLSSKPTREGAFGLSSVRRRLALRYSDAASLRLESSASGARSVVELPWETGAAS